VRSKSQPFFCKQTIVLCNKATISMSSTCATVSSWHIPSLLKHRLYYSISVLLVPVMNLFQG